MMKKKRIIKIFAIITALSILNTAVFPTVAFALTSGPNSPEFSSFEPVATTDMVDVFSGDFTYNLPVVNIPGPDGGGYSLSLSYHSGVTPEEEASWVGYGWTLNPGAINRSKAGYPDDYKASDVTKYNKTKPNWSVSAKVDGKLELFSKDQGQGKDQMNQSDIYKKAKKNSDNNKYKSDDQTYLGKKNFDRLSDRGKSLGALNLSKSVRFNNYKGFFKTYGFGVDVKGYGGLSMQGGSGGISSLKPSVDVMSILGKLATKKNDNDQNEQKKAHDMDEQKKKTAGKKFRKAISAVRGMAAWVSRNLPSLYSVETYIYRGMPFTVGTYRGKVLDRSVSVQANVFAPVGIEAGFTGNYNIQVNKAEMNLEAYGYLYNPDKDKHEVFNAVDNSSYHDNVISDYVVERQTGYHRKDKYLSIPYSTPDNYVVTGEQMMGGFSYHYKKQGHYYPNFEFSKQVITKGGLEIGVGPTFQVGFDFGFGNQTTKLRDWYSPISGSPLNGMEQFVQDKLKSKGFFRFTNDMGGNIEYSTGNEPETAGLDISTALLSPDAEEVRLSELSGYSTKRSSYIDFNLIENLKNFHTSDIRFNKTNSMWDNLSDDYNDLIGEFSITNETGMNYVYGLPVFTKNETNVSIGVDNSLSQTIENNYILLQKLCAGSDVLKNKIVTGEKRDNPYAMNYLLTQILTHDYIDVGDDGPDENDIGGWTQFHYRQWESTETTPQEWYRYRTPYYGMNYNEGNLADKTDDMGTVMTGDKQVYYLKTIETKSHVAFFVTNKSIPSHYIEFTGGEKDNLAGSGEPRKDSYGAVPYNSTPSGATLDPAGNSKDLKNEGQSLEKLEKIVVYSKKDFSKPLQTVHFEYTNSLCAGLPNAENGAGKLTLKKVWFENQGIVRSKIAPYQFEYTYPANYPDHIGTKYPGINAFLASFNGTDESNPPTGEVVQNPPYAPYALDMWGNYQANGATRHENHIPWVYQGEQPVFDAAAWNLKKIILPSGGEIHIQYEQKDYAYVQDKKALVMAPLKDISSDSYKPDDTKFYLDLNSIGITDENEKRAYADVLKAYFLADKGELPPHHIYFKFLYSLMGNRAAGFNHCESEYVSGFTSVNDIGYDDAEGTIYLRLGDGRMMEEVYRNFYSGVNRENTPKRLCYEYVANNMDGMLKGNHCGCEYGKRDELETAIQSNYNTMIKGDDYSQGQFNVGAIAAESIFEVSKHLFDGAPKKNNVCKDINYPFSYLRVPVLKSKKGGGVRVKRLLMYDQGMNDGIAKLYGSEYIYELENGLSSGVATNEPGAGHEENALVQLLERKSQKFLGRVIAGEDKKKMQGPLGESVLPGPSIGYSRVVEQNIHTGKSNTGHTVHEFNTVKKYPLVVKTTDINDVKVKVPLYTNFFNLILEKYWLTQGFSFVNRNMHGKPHKTSNYSGVYEQGSNEDKLVSYTLYDYFDFENEKMPLLKYNPNTRKFSVTKENPGKEEKVTMEMRAVTDKLLDIELELDINLLFSTVVPTITIGIAPKFVFQDKSISSHINSKVVSYPAVTKKITNFVDGGITSTENVAFNPANGKPVVTKTFDSYHDLTLVKSNKSDKHDGSINNYTIPADMIYPELGQKSVDKDNDNRLSEQAMSFTTYGKGHWLDSIIHVRSSEWNDDAISTNAVIAANATKYENNWFTGDNESILDVYSIPDAYHNELNDVLRPAETYIFNTSDISSANDPENRIYNGGIIEQFTMFDWQRMPDPKWLKTSTITKYSPHGNPLEEYDVLNIYSAVRYGYQGYFPVITAKNAAYSSIYFDDFENNADAERKATAHSGRQCLDLNQYMGTNLVSASHGLKVNEHILNEGALIKVWLCNEDEQGHPIENNEAGFQAVINNNVTAPFEKIASTGKWTLYQAYIKDWENKVMLNDNITIGMEYNLAQNEKVFIDDLRFQPYDASATCYVYDANNYRLITQFDDQHFGVFYQYNAEGKLVRRMIETERGLKTLKETQYNTKRKERDGQ